MSYEIYWRQLGIVSPRDLDFPITIIGAGGIGSPTAFLLAKMGCSNITVMDPDTVESHNLPNQLYRIQDIGKPKVEALADIIASYTGTAIKTRQERYESQELSGVVIVGVDTMKTRSDIWSHVRINIQVPFFIEARMGGKIAHIYALCPWMAISIERYEQTLYDDSKAVEEPCTQQAIIYNVFMIAGIIGRLVKAYAKDEPLPIKGIVQIVDFHNMSLL